MTVLILEDLAFFAALAVLVLVVILWRANRLEKRQMRWEGTLHQVETCVVSLRSPRGKQSYYGESFMDETNGEYAIEETQAVLEEMRRALKALAGEFSAARPLLNLGIVRDEEPDPDAILDELFEIESAVKDMKEELLVRSP